MRKIKLLFWLHFMFALVSHLIMPVMLIGAVKILFDSQLDIWLSGLILGATFFSCTYLINHITNPDGFCVLTDLENYYRQQLGLSKVDRFLPRFYEMCKRIRKRNFRIPL